jgi:rubrerythrin
MIDTRKIQTITSIEAALDVAIRVEQAGRDFYAKAREAARDPRCRTLFSFLAAEEERHLGAYRAMMETVPGGAFQQDVLVGEYGMYIEMLGREITGGLAPVEGLSLEDTLDMAVTLEKNTLLFYNELARLAKDEALRDAVEKIIREEQNHLVRLAEFRADFFSGE